MTETKKLPARVKVGLGLSSWGNNILVLMNTYFLLYFYTNVVGISGGAAGTIMLIARVWDAVNDPMMGVIVDRTKSKEGRCRFWIKYFSIPAAVIFALSYFCPAVSTPGKIAWVAVTYILQGMASTVISVSTNALQARVTDLADERVPIQQIGSIGSVILSLTIPSLTLPMVRAFGGSSGDLVRGFGLTVGIYSIFFALFRLCGYFFTKGYDSEPEKTRVQGDGSRPAENQAREENENQAVTSVIETEVRAEKKVGRMLKSFFADKYALTVSISYFCYLVVAAIMGSTTVYYFQYNLHNTGLMTLYSVTVMIGSLIGIATMKPLFKRLGNAGSCVFCGVIVMIGCLIRWVSGDRSMALFSITMVILGYGSGMIGTYSVQCIMDACTLAKLSRGEENQATTMSLFTFFQKAGQALGGVTAGWLLEAVPFDANAQEQAASVQDLFFAENIIIPLFLATFLVIGFLIVTRYEKQLKALQAEKG